MTSPLTPRQEAEDVEAFGASRDHAQAVSGGAGTPAPPIPEGTLYPRGFMPRWTEARDAEQAIYGLSYILQQIQGTDTYKPFIGQTTAAQSSLEFAIRALADGVGRAPRPTVADGEGSRDDHLQSSEEAQDLRRANPLEPDFRRMG